MEQNDTKQQHYESVYRADRWAKRFITAGGYGIIVSILAILLFLVYQSLPLGQNASLKHLLSYPVTDTGNQVLLTGSDSYMEIFYTLDQAGRLNFYHISDGSLVLAEKLPLGEGEKLLSAARGSLGRDVFAAGSDSGRVITAEISMTAVFSDSGRVIVPSLDIEETWTAESAGDSISNHIEQLAFVQNEDLSRFWAWKDHVGNIHLRIYDADDEETYQHTLQDYFQNLTVTAMTLSHGGDNFIAGTQSGDLFWFKLDDFESPELKDTWKSTQNAISSLQYLLGDQALVIGDNQGAVESWFPVRTPANWLKFTQIHRFESHPAPVTQIYTSSRNRNFLTVDNKGNVKLHYATTGQTELNFRASDFPIQAAGLTPKSNGIIAVDGQRQFTLFQLNDPHPESTFQGLFGKVWYEGYPQPEFVWQSTGGSDEFEPKLSLIPLIFGTLKGTLYAMLFSVPIAIMAAIYVSQFSPHWLARAIKPTVEIMAALPSVVIGFLAGLYFSPLFEEYLMGFLSVFIFLPVVFILAVLIWRMVPEHHRTRLKPGTELALLIPVVSLAIAISIWLGPTIEAVFFGANFQQWIFTNLGVTYETRNSLVVGFALGFAVIPIIFTMAEDALTNVPESLSSASLALGASRWQTVRRVILPAASGGIFAATMLGLGRAVGETMIVLMATGNTPILDLNPFNGFRAMSACIAVEIPEAPVGGTLYRVLFFTALLLFVFTFVINTVSSMIGERLRKKYARF